LTDEAVHTLALIAGGIYLLIIVGWIIWLDYEMYKDYKDD